MGLYAAMYNGSPITSIDTYGELEVDKEFLISDASVSGYAEVSSITNWHMYGQAAGRDYKYVRERIKELSAASGWENLTTGEKVIAATWFAVEQGCRNEVFTMEQQIQLGVQFHANSVASRQTRFMFASMEVYNRLPKAEADHIVTEIKDDNLAEQYINYGREGTENGDPVGLFDYVLAVSGTPYESTGILAQDIHPSGMNRSEFVTRLVDIVGSGNYP